MNLITFSFKINSDDQLDFVQSLDGLRAFWDNEGITVSLFRDSSKVDRFFLIFLTEKGIDEITELIQKEPEARAVFEKMKELKGNLAVSCFERVL